MMRTLEVADIASRAKAQADSAAGRADVTIELVEDPPRLREVCDLFSRVWGTEAYNAILPVGVLRAMTHAGNYAAGAYRDGRIVGGVVGFLGHDDWGPYLHSHILGVVAQRQGSSVGFALKLHQRAWALAIGLRKVTWTFDPLVSRNAYFNLQKLGAQAGAYHEHFYGNMPDEINAGDETDRLLVVWDLIDERVERAAQNALQEAQFADAAIVLADVDGEPDVREAKAPRVACQVPEDIVEIRRADRDRALRWRRALRSTLGERMHDGYRVSGFTRSGSYVLSHDDQSD